MSDLDDAKRVMAYLIGYRMGSQILPQMLSGLEAGDLPAEALGKGVNDGLAGTLDASAAGGDVKQRQATFLAMLQERAQARAKANREKGRAYLEANGRKPGVTTTASGLQYEVLAAGGARGYSPEVHGEAPTAEVMYKGTLVDGTVFDQSQKPVKFNIRQVIPGFTEALKLMPIGAKWRVTIPSELAYGANGPGSIGPHSTLVFEMELLGLSK